MLKIRLARAGKKKDPFYSVVAIESTKKRGGQPVAKIGYWQPRENKLDIDKKILKKFVADGAIVSQAVQKLVK
jgi:small subunit ribosomal protein S16